MLGEQFYTWLRQATAEDLQRAREAIQFEIEMREQQQRMAYERHWREFPLPCIHVCQREGCQRLCSHQLNHPHREVQHQASGEHYCALHYLDR